MSLTIREIIEYAENIEAESHTFYKSAAAVMANKEVKDLLQFLADEETVHFNHLRGMLNKTKITSEQLDLEVSSKINLKDRIVKTAEITKESKAVDILNVAMEREKATESLYKLYITLTNLPETLIKLFEDLRLQEVGHQNRIKLMLDRL